MIQNISVANAKNLRIDPSSNSSAEIGDASRQLSLFPEKILPEDNSYVPAIRRERSQEDLVLLLREANQNLVRAALAAKDMQIKAEMAKKKQDEFLAMMGHELRNPLAPIAMAGDLLKTVPNLPPLVTKIQQTISRQSKHLGYLVDELLDAARLANGNLRIQTDVIDLMEIIESAVETSHPVVDQRHQQVKLDPTPESVFVRGDFIRLTQVFSNLLINASKFSDDGAPIRLTVHCTAHEVNISVRDKGMGIAAEFLPHIFDIFTQAPQGLARTKGGLGIGLALVKSILEMHGGSVYAYSAGLGCGSEFTIRLPQALQGPVASSSDR